MNWLLIGVLGLFEPREIVTRGAPVEIGGERFSEGVTLRTRGDMVEAAAGSRRAIGKLARARGPAITIEVPGKLRRTYVAESATVTVVNGALEIVIRMEREAAVAAAVRAEAPEAPSEAVKAQAVVARSYYTASRGRHARFDFCDTTHCQLLQESAKPEGGPVLAFGGRPVPAMFFRSCGGQTRAASGAPYEFVSVRCEVCERDPFRWRSRVAEVPHNEKERIELVRRFGWRSIPSNDFLATRDGNEFVLEGKGEGHGIGLCQRGAAQMARDGLDFRTILMHYFPGTELIR